MKKIAKKMRRRWRAFVNRPRLKFPHATVRRGTVTVGDGTVIGRVEIDCTGDVAVGRNCVISDGVKVFTHSHLFLEGIVPDISREKRISITGIVIGDNVYIGEGAVILPQVDSIADDSIIGAAAVLTKNVGPKEKWAGNPARKIGYRSEAAAEKGD